ncbi:hypothetical protein [Clostridium manihotivorum]|uniref:Uncharacterized protein n=1 Tax=Clostridium manihotivorum TaxID=2320868 RepID=A0A3R5X449_9CLOT|nr:hypothetical protein [Clostridium manihotivorum]QAA34104.1 hypothetical protein C1I91_22110 [Clostridium manihotivorum]
MKASHMAKGGILTALSVIFLYLSGILPTNRLAFIALASILIPIAIMATSISTSVLIYVSTSILALLLVNKLTAFLYIIFFGSYGFIKYYIERINSILIEYVIKIIFFNLCFFVIYKLYSAFLITDAMKRVPTWGIILAAQVGFLVFDYALTIVITAYLRKFHNKNL